MATNTPTPAPTPVLIPTVTELRPRGKKRLWILIAGVVLLLCAAGGAWFFLPTTAHVTPAAKPEVKPPVFVELEPFTVNLDAEHILQTSIHLQVHSDVDSEQLKRYLPQVRSRILMLMATGSAETLKTAEGKDALTRDIAKRLQQPFAEGVKPVAIHGVYFTAFVIQ